MLKDKISQYFVLKYFIIKYSEDICSIDYCKLFIHCLNKLFFVT